MNRLEETAARVCELVGDQAEAECRVTHTVMGLTRFANSHIHQHHGEDTVAVRLRVAVGGRVTATNAVGVDDDDLGRLVDQTLEAARLQPVDPDWPGVGGPVEPVGMEKIDQSTIDATPAARAEQVVAFVEAGAGLGAAGYLHSGLTEVAVATTGGLAVSGRTTRATIDGIHQTAESAGNGHQTDIALGSIDGASVGGRAARLAERGRHPRDVEPGEYEVVLAPECVATIVTFLAVYGFNGRPYNDGQSFVSIGDTQFDPIVQLADDPEDARVAALGFDAEGTPKRRLPLVEDGVSRAVAHDRRTARQADTVSTGHALPEVPFGPVPVNLVFGAGQTSPEDLFGGVKRGIFVSTFNYCRILDPRTQVVTGLTRNGTFLIEDGELSQSLTNLRFTQSFVDALAPGAVLGAGNDQRYADAEFGPGLVIAPSLRLAAWNFTGGAKG